MMKVLVPALLSFALVSAAYAAESDEDRACNARFAAAARYLKSTSPAWLAMAHHSIDLNHKYPQDWTDDKVQDSKLRHRQDMDAVLAQLKSGEITIEQVFADVNACETRLGMPVTTLAVDHVPTD
jgi:hypothetical protein